MKERSLLAQWRKKKAAAKSQPQPEVSTPIEDKSVYPLSPGQKRLWLLQSMQPDSPFYNYAETYTLNGPLEIEALKIAFKDVIGQHDILRVKFELQDGVLSQRVQAEAAFEFKQEDLRPLPQKEREEEAKNYCLTEARKGFDLEKDIPIRMYLLQLEDDHYILMISMHHIITDKWSMRVLREQLAAYYQYRKALSEGNASAAPPAFPPALQFTKYAEKQNKTAVNQKAIDDLAKKLQDSPTITNLPRDRKHPAQPSNQGAYLQRDIGPVLSRKIKERCKENGVTLFAYLLSCYQVLLRKYSQEEHLTVGVPITKRAGKEMEQMIGFNNETAVIHNQIPAGQSFLDILTSVANVNTELFAYREIPFDALVQAVNPTRVAGVNPLFQTMFILHVEPESAFFGPDLRLHPTPLDIGVTKFDLTCYVSDKGDELEVLFEYAKDIFDDSTANRIIGHYIQLLHQIVEDENKPFEAYTILPVEEKQQLASWNQPAATPHTYNAVQEVFSEIAKGAPAAIAVAYASDHLSYETLDLRTTQLAKLLLQKGVQKGDFIGLYCKPSVELIIGILSILKAGGVYLPLDPNYPAARTKYLITDTDCQLILCHSTLPPPGLEQQQLFYIDQDNQLDNSLQTTLPTFTENDAAYVIYTSGSTGKPKGVVVSHQNLLYSTLARNGFYQSSPSAFLLLSSFSFDSSVAGIFWSLCTGGKLVMAPPRIEQDLELLASIIRTEEISHTLLLPSLYAALLSYSDLVALSFLKTVIVAGEACRPALVKQHFERLPNTRLYNEYGPTETTVWCTAYELSIEDANRDIIPIGSAIPNYEVFVLQPDGLQLSPIGVAGELYIGGKGLTKGYWKRPELTAQKFVQTAALPGKMLYRTGDLVKWTSDGKLLFLGRIDRQIKIRGYRVELGEIQSAISRYPGVEEVIVRTDKKQTRIWAFIKGISPQELPSLRDTLSDRLPNYMVPSVMEIRTSFPTLPNGKIDESSLTPSIKSSSPNSSAEITATEPQGNLSEPEKQLKAIWEEVLRIEHINVNDNYFDLGGDSILSIQIVAKARQKGVRLQPQAIFIHQTIRALARFGMETKLTSVIPNEVSGPFPLSPIQHWFFAEHTARPQHWNMGIYLEVPAEISQEAMQDIVHLLWKTHPGLRQQFNYSPRDGWTAQITEIGTSEGVYNYIQGQFEEDKIEEILADNQLNFSLEQTNLFRVFHLHDTTTKKASLVMVAHHLVVDIVSWQILSNDYRTLEQSYITNQALELAKASTSFPQWAEQLKKWAHEEQFLAELEHWEATNTGNAIPLDLKGSLPVQEGSIRFEKSTLHPTYNPEVFARANRAFHTTTEELLLIAFGLSMQMELGIQQLGLNLEHNGRNPMSSNLDLSRSIGWFTAAYPLSLDLPEVKDWATIICSLKEQIRQLPNKGIGYGVLRYLGLQPGLTQQPMTFFNYLGQHVSSKQSKGYQMISKGMRSQESLRHRVWELNIGFFDDQLEINWSYSNQLHTQATIQRLSQVYLNKLEQLLDFCTQQTTPRYTPADFNEITISQEELDELQDRGALITSINSSVEAIRPLSDLQQSLLFHSLSEQLDQGIIQTSAIIEGPLELDRFKNAWRAVTTLQPALRNAIHWKGLRQPYSIELRNVDPIVNYQDISAKSEDSQKKLLNKFKHEDAQLKFNFTKASLNRISIFQLGKERFSFHWTTHHILLDGWSNTIILGQLQEAYHQLGKQPTVNWPALPPIQNYTNWLKDQDRLATAQYWKNTLTDLPAQARWNKPKTADNPVASQQIEWQVETAVNEGLQQFLQQHRLTLQPLIQALWTIVQAKQRGANDLYFGTTLAGRPPEVEGLDQLAGLFTNTIPIRLNLDPLKSVKQWCQHVQKQAIERQAHVYASVNEIADWANISSSRLETDHLLLVQKFPRTTAPNTGLKFKDFSGDITSTFPITVVVVQDTELSLYLRYDDKIISEELANWYLHNLGGLLTNIKTLENDTIDQVMQEIPQAPMALVGTQSPDPLVSEFTPPDNTTEVELLKIWEGILNKRPISTSDDFFVIGGSSLLAVRCVSKINDHFGSELPPISLLQNRSIKSFATLLIEGEPKKTHNHLIPLRASGQGMPLFCFHGGLGHVFFYRELANLIDFSHPVYAVQPQGLSGQDQFHEDVKTMAADYLNEMLSLYPDGKFCLLGYCFSNLVCVEIAHQMAQRGLPSPIIIIADSAPSLSLVERTDQDIPSQSSWAKKLLSNLYRKRFDRATEQLKFDILPEWASDKTDRQLYQIKRQFERLTIAYLWPRLDQEIYFLRSSMFAALPKKGYQENSWSIISNHPPVVKIVEGTHRGLFKQPAVNGFAAEVNSILAKGS